MDVNGETIIMLQIEAGYAFHDFEADVDVNEPSRLAVIRSLRYTGMVGSCEFL